MSEELLATEVSLARDEILTQSQLNALHETGRKRRVKKTPEVVVTVEPTETVATPVEAEPEPPQDPWADRSPMMRRLISHFSDLPESHVLDPAVRNLFAMTESATKVEDFDRFTDGQLVDFLNTIRDRLPQITREMNAFMTQLSSARTIAVDVDFI